MEPSQKKTYRSAIGKAIARETGAYNFYMKEAARSANNEAEALFLHLANEEMKHRNFLREELQRLETVNWSERREDGRSFETVSYRLPETVELQQTRQLPFIDMAVLTLPSEFLSGDHLQTFSLPQEQAQSLFALFLHDVMGHGSRASFLNSTIKLFLAQQLEDLHSGHGECDVCSPNVLLEKLNSHIYPECHENDAFVTAFFAVIDDQQGRLTYASAGHEPPVVIRASGEYTHLDRTELLLGAVPSISYSPVTVEVGIGDVIVLFSDGITEVTDADDKMFGRQGLIAAAERTYNLSASEILNAIIRRVREHVGTESINDDFSIAVIKLIEP